MAKSGAEEKITLWQKFKSYGAPLKSGGAAVLYSSTLSAAYDFISNSCSILLPVHVRTAKRSCIYRIEQNGGEGKLWRIWRIWSNSPKFYPAKFAAKFFDTRLP